MCVCVCVCVCILVRACVSVWPLVTLLFQQEYSTILTFREEWLDERLKYNDFGGTDVAIDRGDKSQLIFIDK